MCLVITAFAAVITTLIWYFRMPQREYLLGRLVLMYWGAVLMWCVDGFFSVAEGEGFLNLSMNDALLGIVVVLCGMAAWTVMVLFNDPKKLLLKKR